MDQICLVVPILPGRTADVRDFMRELEADRRTDYQDSEQRIGIVKEAWYLARTPAGDQLVGYLESPDFPTALSMFSRSQDEFDRWFKQRLADATGAAAYLRLATQMLPAGYRVDTDSIA